MLWREGEILNRKHNRELGEYINTKVEYENSRTRKKQHGRGEIREQEARLKNSANSVLNIHKSIFKKSDTSVQVGVVRYKHSHVKLGTKIINRIKFIMI